MNDRNLSAQIEISGEPDILTPRKALNKAWLKVKPDRSGIETFKANLIGLLEQGKQPESEEYHKNNVSAFLKNTWYAPNHYINTKGRSDLVIHNGNTGSSPVGVLIETKRPGGQAEMLRKGSINRKALHELVLYYLRERITQNNLEIKYLVVTDIHEWFIFDASIFEKLVAGNKQLVKNFNDFEEGRLSGTNTEFFYDEIAAPFIASIESGLDYTYFDIQDYERPLRNDDRKDDNKLIILFKLLSPQHLLKLPFVNDSNSLDRSFYTELLHIIGLTETKQKGKKLIERKKEGERDGGSLIENAIVQLDALDKISRLDNPHQYGETRQERYFNVALELIITWVNRILFLKLLEAQQINYHKGDKTWSFLNSEKIGNFDDLNSLFFSVLARKPAERNEYVKSAFARVPYLNSSLFEPTDLEHDAILISNLRDERKLPILSTTVLRERSGKRRTGELTSLEYLFEFLNAYDFSSEGSEEIQEDNKRLINASVLGLIFEKINGYKDGSFFTPGFITMYMCRETIRRAVVQKFKDLSGFENLTGLDDIYNAIGTKITMQEANAVINSLKICDPAVGSGHFLVSALNEIIAIKSDLGILTDRSGNRKLRVHVEVVNDELIVTDEDGFLFEYKPNSPGSRRVQEALFHEKQTIIENCLFGVDINPNSVKICRLRLWIELLKNAYYRDGGNGSPYGELETLPNIDINIKCGNSLISRFALDSGLKSALKKSKWSIESYRLAVQTYRNAHNKDQKNEMKQLIADIKSDFRSEIAANDPKLKKLNKLSGELYNLLNQQQMFDLTKTEKKARQKKQDKLEKEMNKLSAEIEEIKSNRIYEKAFEWRFEFPEVLSDEGEYIGFDVILGNPPYIRQEELSDIKPYLYGNYQVYQGTADLYGYFIELGIHLLRDNGHFQFIVANKWMRANYGKPMREWLQKNVALDAIYDFGDLPVFVEATTYPCLLQLRKAKPAGPFKAFEVKDLEFENLRTYLNENRFDVDQSKLQPEGWNLVDEKAQKLLEKIKNQGVTLEEYVDGKIYRGVLTGLNEAFVIDEETKERLIAEDPKSEELIKPFLAGRDIKRYKQPESNKYLIFARRGIAIEKYPAILKHLTQFKEQLMPKPKDWKQKDWSGRKPGTYKWYEIQDAVDYYDEFEKPKIIVPAIVKSANYGFDEESMLSNDKTTIIPRVDDALYGILNSKVADYFISQVSSTKRGGYYEYKPMYVGQIPIPKINSSQCKALEKNVSQIMLFKKEKSQADTHHLESEIDQLVYELYGLTEEEASIIESGSN